MTNKRLLNIYFIIFFIILLTDQLSKLAVTTSLSGYAQGIPIFQPYLDLFYFENPIISPLSLPIYFIMLTLIFPYVAKEFILPGYHCLTTKLGIILVFAGFFSNNILDAFYLGYVRDFIRLQGFGVGNIADQSKYIGCIITMLGILKDYKILKNKRAFAICGCLLTALFIIYMKIFYSGL